MTSSTAATDNQPSELTPIPDEILKRDLAIALKVIRPRVQIGAGKRLPDQADADAATAAKLLVEHLRMSGVRCFQMAPRLPHRSPPR